MSEFLDRFDGLQIGWRDGRPLWETHAPLRYRSDRLGATVVIPAELITDLASVPRAPLLWMTAGGRGIRSAVLHDLAYQRGELLLARAGHAEPLWSPVDRSLADEVFWESLRADPWSGAVRVVAWLMWAAVRIGGRGVWSQRAWRAAELNPIWTHSGWPSEAP